MDPSPTYIFYLSISSLRTEPKNATMKWSMLERSIGLRSSSGCHIVNKHQDKRFLGIQ